MTTVKERSDGDLPGDPFRAKDAPKVLDQSLLDLVAHNPRASNRQDLEKLQIKTPKDGARVQKDSDVLARSLSHTLTSVARRRGPRVMRGNIWVAPPQVDPDFLVNQGPTSDAGLKPTTVFHNLSPAELYEKALQYDRGSHIVASGALATMSGAHSRQLRRRKDRWRSTSELQACAAREN